jgi:hypothetical protein
VGFLFDPRHCLNGPSAALNRSVEVGVVSAVFGAPSRPPPPLDVPARALGPCA